MCLDVSTGKILVPCHVVFDKSLYPYKFLECVEPNYKNDHVVLLRSLIISSFSSSFSANINFQSVALSPMHMVSTSSHQTNLGIVSGYLARGTTLPQHEDSLTPPL